MNVSFYSRPFSLCFSYMLIILCWSFFCLSNKNNKTIGPAIAVLKGMHYWWLVSTLGTDSLLLNKHVNTSERQANGRTLTPRQQKEREGSEVGWALGSPFIRSWIISFWTFSFLFFCMHIYVCGHVCAIAHVWRSEGSSLLQPCRFWKLNANPQAWLAGAITTKSSHFVITPRINSKDQTLRITECYKSVLVQ